MITEDGFEVTLEESKLSFLRDSYELRIRKVIKYGETQIVPKELTEDTEFISNLIEQLKQRINDRINCAK